jgi:hypothetical protein
MEPVVSPPKNAWFILHLCGPVFSHQAQHKTHGYQWQLQLDGGFSKVALMDDMRSKEATKDEHPTCGDV